MANLDERDIVAHARRLARTAPPPDASARAVAAVRAALVAQQAADRARWRRTLWMSGSIAALLAVVIGVTAFLSSTQRADAATLLAQIANVNRAHVGWVHIRTEATDKAGTNLPIDSLITHVNTATGDVAYEMTLDGVRRVSLSRPAAHEEYEYNAARNEIRIRDVVEFIANVRAEHLRNYPVTIAAEVNKMKGRPGAEPTVTEHVEDGLLRVDVAVPARSPATGDHATTQPLALPRKATLWADPATKLLQRTRYEEPDGTTYVEAFTYGPPAVETLHDLGVPRDAKVVDQRPTKELSAVLDRLQKRVDHGFGDGVTMLAKVSRFDGSADQIQLSLRQNGAIFSGKYLIGRPRRGTAIPVAEQPANWPEPTADDVLRALRDAQPMTSIRRRPDASAVTSAMQISQDIPGQIWPTPLVLDFSSSARWELLTDPGRPGLVGIRAVRATDDGEYGREWTFWIDPARDDIPVESVETIKAGKGSVIHNRTVYSDPKQTPSGQWYPTRWRKWVNFDNATTEELMAKEPPTQSYLLRVNPNHPVDPAWFTGPALRIGSRPVTVPSGSDGEGH